MAILKFTGFLPTEEKPKEFEDFRLIASELLDDLKGELTFDYVSKYKQFNISKNSTDKNELQIRKIFGEDAKYIM